MHVFSINDIWACNISPVGSKATKNKAAVIKFTYRITEFFFFSVYRRYFSFCCATIYNLLALVGYEKAKIYANEHYTNTFNLVLLDRGVHVYRHRGLVVTPP